MGYPLCHLFSFFLWFSESIPYSALSVNWKRHSRDSILNPIWRTSSTFNTIFAAKKIAAPDNDVLTRLTWQYQDHSEWHRGICVHILVLWHLRNLGQFDHSLVGGHKDFMLNVVLSSHLIDDEFWVVVRLETFYLQLLSLFGGRLWAYCTLLHHLYMARWVSIPEGIIHLWKDINNILTTVEALLVAQLKSNCWACYLENVLNFNKL